MSGESGKFRVLCSMIKILLFSFSTSFHLFVLFFEHTCAYARWAHMHRFLSDCPSIDQNSD